METLKYKISETYRLLDLLKLEKNFAVAFSGGKDSTLLSILLYKWLRERGVKGKKIIFVHNDTSSELDILEEYARSFLNKICGLIKETGNDCEVIFTVPEHNFYWRVIVAGYPAPNFIFRWCVNHLKVLPNKNALNDLVERYGKIVLLTGHREDESASRARIIKSNSVCGAGEMSCNSSFFLKVDVKNVTKAMPIRNWGLDEVWEFLDDVREEFGLNPLFELYGGNKRARYGCWHCTLVKIQKNIYNLPPPYLYLEGARIIYRVVSDIEEMRLRKDWGRTKLGPLNVLGRAVMLKLFPVVEELSGKRLYGLDEEYLGSYTLREVFYELEPAKSNLLIEKSAKGLRDRKNRLIPIEKIREATVPKDVKDKITDTAKNNVAYAFLSIRGEKYFYEILDRIN
ncbi:phosphoadenosine phosphosulfate reductase family protein [Stygiolobus caldivivus]|uniref:Phosphoadenosine phosphosulphate reductase domain-containing protein n=1 Tax=Stygiolobus caldivivus TaxID=2824673 RepID=A0A8D5U764_9CREN|nr:phosphoadenosine phosphosulfate reductase family protein [Stygiolobus caldivivus]BCU70059.1 hypothetical protein KN1_13560 [Stygiolobus caldivivus]